MIQLGIGDVVRETKGTLSYDGETWWFTIGPRNRGFALQLPDPHADPNRVTQRMVEVAFRHLADSFKEKGDR